MRKFTNETFVILVSLCLFYIFVLNVSEINFWVRNPALMWFMSIGVVAASLWIGVQLNKRLRDFRYSLTVKILLCGAILLFFSYQLLTPYFYSRDKLEEIGMEQTESYFQLSNENSTDKEYEEKVRATLTEMLAFSTLNADYAPQGQLIELKPVKLTRNYSQFHLTMKIERSLEADIVTDTYQFSFIKEDGHFKINGFEEVN
ncbi:hypothetical protein [Halobacillus sp. K22]|uniref:hypothetical protein n=1 Tax=Halobacillus sp. K22 TaxID=3457431 RepID=UPI003FCC899A